MSNQIGRAHQIGMGTFTMTATDNVTMSGTISYQPESLRVVQSGDITEIRNNDGDVVAMTAVNEALEATFQIIPYGTSIANAVVSAQAPRLLTGFHTAGLPDFQMGAFSDALNAAEGEAPWIYVGGWEVNGANSGDPWSISVNLRRYPNITDATDITA